MQKHSTAVATFGDISRHLAYDADTGVFIRKIKAGGKQPGTIAGGKGVDGYWVLRVDGVLYLAHRVAWMLHYGQWPKSQIDHINRVKTDNRIVNLRDVGYEGNNQNKPVKVKTAGTRRTKWGTWEAVIWFNKKSFFLGTYPTQEEAHAAYLKAKLEKHSFRASSHRGGVRAKIVAVTTYETRYVVDIEVRGELVEVGIYQTEQEASSAWSNLRLIADQS